MGATFIVVAYAEDQQTLKDGVEAAFAEAGRLDRMLSNYRPESEWSKVNREAAQEPVQVSPELFQLLEYLPGGEPRRARGPSTSRSAPSCGSGASSAERAACPPRARWPPRCRRWVSAMCAGRGQPHGALPQTGSRTRPGRDRQGLRRGPHDRQAERAGDSVGDDHRRRQQYLRARSAAQRYGLDGEDPASEGFKDTSPRSS